MNTIEIARDDWSATLQQFGAAHDGWLVSLDLLSAELGAQVAFQNLPLLSISTDDANDSEISVSVEQPRGDLIRYVIVEPKRLCLERTLEGADSALMIEDSVGTTAILRLRSAVLPETVDGIARGTRLT